MMQHSFSATAIGILAILMWSTLVGLIALIRQHLDALSSVTLLYSLSSIMLCLLFKWPHFNQIAKKYYLLIIVLFVVYELCFSFSVALATTARQTIEVGVINHLWPTFTILMMLFFSYMRFSFKLIFGLLLSALGVIVIQTNGFNLAWSSVADNLLTNPLSYTLALMAAIIWAFYCIVLMKYKPDHNLIVVLFLLTSLTLWIKWLFFSSASLTSLDNTTIVLLLCASACLSLGYAAWNIGITRGNAAILVSSSYFIPIISAFFSSLVFQIPLGGSFWLGTSLIVTGSLVCWMFTSYHKV